ncbi:MAG: AAA family ATPase [Clostridiales bacterium]|nr:AAA family ATPase [Clostridiales bacterium]
MSSGVNRIWNVRNRTGDKDIPFDLESYVYDNNVVLVENILDEKRQCNYLAKMDHGDIVVFGRDQHIDAVGIVDDYEPETLDKPPFYYQRKIKWLATGLNKSFDDIGKTKMSISNFAIAKSRLSMLDINNLINNHRDNTSPCVFIIDEINRGNISKIFGELITLIEDTKREGMDEEASATLPYSGEPFSVPKNVYLLGTMNTADRSIATIDTALRRRFAFEEMLPDSTILEGIDIGGINIENMLDSMNQKISVLFDREHTIGHAYFIPLRKNSDMKTLARVFKNNIIPLLQEYFYEDYEKIRLVLGDNKKQDESMQFIKAINNDYMSLFGEDVDLDVSYRYEINEAAFNNPEAYKYI